MYRAILAEGELRCESYEMGDHGVDLYDADEEFVAFVPYSTLEAIIDAEAYDHEDPATM